VITVRAMTPDDLEWCHALNQHNVPALGTETSDDFARLLDIAAVAVVAEVDGHRAGFAISMIEGTDYASVNYRWFAERYPALVYLDRVAVADTHKGLGIGRAIYDETDRLGRLASPAATVFCLEVNLEPRNDESLAFHDRLGFGEVGQLRTPSGKLVSLMTRPLA
jgi:hypothetical protein